MYIRFTKVVLSAMLALFFFAVRAGAFTAKVSEFDGDVTFKRAEKEMWQDAEKDLSLASGDEIKSARESWAEISFSQGHKTRLGPASYMKIDAIDEETNLELFNGELFSKVRELSSNENFQIQTPESVVSVKGTEFTVLVNESAAETLVKVLSGEVSAMEIVTGEKVLIPAGSFSLVKKDTPPGKPQGLDQLGGEGDGAGLDEEESGDDNEDELAETPQEGDDAPVDEVVDPRQRQLALRNEIRTAVEDIRTDIRQAQDVIEQKKESDSATGRTLKDFHGNLVRVEQHLMRPENDTLQFVNITKRDNYNYKGRMSVNSSGARLDYFETKIEFNKSIPEKVSGWFDFIQDIEDSGQDFHPTGLTMKVSNQADSIIVESQWDDIKDEMGEPDITFVSYTNGEWKPQKVDGEVQENGSGIAMDAEDKIEMWAISPGLVIEDVNGEETPQELRLGIEGWLINDDGNVFNVTDLEEGDINPFTLLREIAFQMSITGRYDLENTDFVLNDSNIVEDDSTRAEALDGFNTKGKDFFSNNFDLVATPDTALNIIEEIAKNVDLSKIDED